jgi:hypothetical protein
LRYRRTTVALAALLAPLTFLAACGDDDDAATDSSTTESVADSTEAPADSTPDSAADSTETTPESGESSGSGGDFCAVLEDFTALEASTAEPEDLPDVFAEFDDRADEFLDAAPDEVRADAELVVDSARQVKDVLESNDFDIAEALADPEFMTAFSAEATEAQDRIDDWADTNCA